MIIANANNAKIQKRWSEGHGSQESSGPVIYPHVTTLIWKNDLNNKYFFGEMSCMKYLCWWDDGGQEPIIVPVWVISDNMGRPLVWPAGLLQCSVSVATPGWAVLQYYTTVRAGRRSLCSVTRTCENSTYHKFSKNRIPVCLLNPQLNWVNLLKR